MSNVTIYDIAAEAGLSSSSVSRILRGGKGHAYSAVTVERVHEIARRTGYRTNAAARLLSQGSQTMIGMSVHLTEHPYLNRFLAAVYEELLKREYDPIFIDSKQLSNEQAFQPFPPPHMLSGLISMGIDLQEGWPRHYSDLGQNLPIVAVQPVSPEAAAKIDVVQVDTKSAYLQAFEHLKKLGHRNIAYLTVVDDPYPTDASKLDGWKAAAKQCKLSGEYIIPWTIGSEKPVNPLSRNSDFIYQPEAREGMREVIARLKSFPEQITALMCGSDEVAIAMQSFLQSEGWKIPEELSVIGYDGIHLGAYVLPALTTIAPDYERMAELAVQQLVSRLKGETSKTKRPQRLLVEPKLVVRESTAPARL